MVQRKLTLTYANVNGRKRRQSSTMLNFQGQRKLTLAFQPIRKAPQGHREPTHCSAMATHGRIRWPVYTSIHGVTCVGTRLLLLCNVYAQRGSASTNGRKKPSLNVARYRVQQDVYAYAICWMLDADDVMKWKRFPQYWKPVNPVTSPIQGPYHTSLPGNGGLLY